MVARVSTDISMRSNDAKFDVSSVQTSRSSSSRYPSASSMYSIAVE